MRKYVTNSPEETYALARGFAQQLKGGCTIALDGGLGAGKTVFVQGLAAGLGIEKPILSPTFTIVRQYHGRLPLNHFDVYRLEDPQELYEIGFLEYLGSGQVTVIEGACRIAAALPKDTLFIEIEGAGEEPRTIILRGEELLERAFDESSEH